MNRGGTVESVSVKVDVRLQHLIFHIRCVDEAMSHFIGAAPQGLHRSRARLALEQIPAVQLTASRLDPDVIRNVVRGVETTALKEKNSG